MYKKSLTENKSVNTIHSLFLFVWGVCVCKNGMELFSDMPFLVVYLVFITVELNLKKSTLVQLMA